MAPNNANNPKSSTKFPLPEKENILRSSVLEEYKKARADALPLTRAANRDTFMTYFKWGDSNHDPQQKVVAKVSLATLLSYSTLKERALMSFGVIMATLTGLGLPTWLVLLARTLDTFSNLAILMDKLGSVDDLMELLRSELNKLCMAFAIVGFICLVSGFAYVSIWTFTGEKQALRIQEEFVRASLNQDASWFDKNDREALPTKMNTALIHINNAIGRQVVDVYSNGVSAAGCLAVALLLNTPLALIMLCVVPVALIILALFNMCIRKVKKRANAELAQAGGIATEVLAGIKTVAALCAQPYFRKKYEDHINESAKYTIWASFLSSALAGITGALFYVTYTFAFIIGTEQVQEGATMPVIVKCLLSNDPNCRVTGASVMCCIYGVILCVTYFGLMGPGISIVNLGRSSAVDVFDTLLRKPVMDPSSDEGRKLERVEGKIEFRNVFFCYTNNPDRPIFYNFNLNIEPGQSVALVGPSGELYESDNVCFS
jgi:ATP-binding cassette subfamily B (MDR/TAP) protein 1